MHIDQILQQHISKAILALYQHTISESEIKLGQTRKEFEGSHTYTTFPLTKFIKASPDEIANRIGEYLIKNCSQVSKYNVVKGFLNISLTDSYLLETLIDNGQIKTFQRLPSKNTKVMVEFSSPNTNKPLHLGHLRNNFLGDSVSKILEFAGYTVIKANLVNDRGIHICKSMLAYQKFGNGETPQSSGIKGDHLVGKYYVEFEKQLKLAAQEMKINGATDEEIEKNNPLLKQAQSLLVKWEEGDSDTVNLWKTMNSWVLDGFDQTYKKLNISFDKTYYESETYLLGKSIVEEGLQKNVFFKKPDGSVWIDLTKEGLDQKLVLRADGTSVYITQDLGTADLKYRDFGVEKSIYVVGNEQDYHFVVLKHILKKLGRSYADGIYHLSYGMVDLPSGKMKSREGTVVDADDLIQEMIETAQKTTLELGKTDGFTQEQLQDLYHTIGLGALKYFLLKVEPKKRMLFNPAESIDFHGHTGPFIQYTHARIKAILRKAEQLKLEFSVNDIDKNIVLHSTEREILLHLSNFDKMIEQAASTYEPSLVAQYVYDLAKLYNSFYAELSIFMENDLQKQKMRVLMSAQVAACIKQSMALLGIQVPDRM
jgi:arginyl-tRNA synthetase